MYYVTTRDHTWARPAPIGARPARTDLAWRSDPDKAAVHLYCGRSKTAPYTSNVDKRYPPFRERRPKELFHIDKKFGLNAVPRGRVQRKVDLMKC